jgi:hypothetical protein
MSVLLSTAGAAAQAPATLFFDGPPAPVEPAVIARDESGRVTVRAIRLSNPLTIDGRLNESIYAETPSMSDFIQSAPLEGQKATEITEVWVFYDEDNVYVSVRAHESDPSRIVASEMRRDNTSVFAGSDAVGFILDTFYDRRNGALFTVNAVGGLADGQVTNESVYNANWNPIWDAQVTRIAEGWSFEAVVPFKSLRYQPGDEQVWGFNVRRVNRAKNEESFLTRIPIAKVQQGILQSSLAATLVGLRVPSGARNLDVKPYVTGSMATDLAVTPQRRNDATGDVGLDVKYGITQNISADFTYNTDFAQVEADEQQINLTRFSLFFPEKREFFLENQGLFEFGGIQATSSAGDSPILFYTRRIGLTAGRPVPIDVGGRLTGRTGRYSFGALAINTGTEPSVASSEATFSVVRLKRDVFRRSSVGMLFTSRSSPSAAANFAYGLDGVFALSPNLTLNSYWARTRTIGRTGDDVSYRGDLNYAGDRYGLQVERLAIGRHFLPEVGFVRRTDLERSFAQGRFSPRLRNSRLVRRLSWVAGLTYIENSVGRVETRSGRGEFAIEFHSSDRLALTIFREREFVPVPFPVASAVVLPEGEYDYGSAQISYTLGQQRKISGNVALEHGSFYSGRKTTWSVSRGRLSLVPRLTFEPNYSLNIVDLPEGDFTTNLVGTRVTYTMTPRMFASALVQFNSDARMVSSNARVRWEYQPGSEFFAVYTDERDTADLPYPGLVNRSFVIKVNRLFRF